MQGQDGHDVRQLAGLGLVVDRGAGLVHPDVAADHLVSFSLVTSGGETPVRAGQQAAGVLVGVDPRRADPGGFEHGDGLGFQAGQ
jgi:hypothetical protein